MISNQNSDHLTRVKNRLTLYQRLRIGEVHPCEFRANTSFLAGAVSTLKISHRLKGHRGCVNTVMWNRSGTLLASGSDDCDVRIYSNTKGFPCVQRVDTGHVRNIFCAQFRPGNDNQLISMAMDGQVRWHDRSTKKSVLLHECNEMAYKSAFLPDSSDVFVAVHGGMSLFDLRSAKPTRQPLAHTCPDAKTIAFDPLQSMHFAIGGDDTCVLIYDFRKASDPFKLCPSHLIGQVGARAFHSLGGVTGVAWNDQHELVANYGNEEVYLFDVSEFNSPKHMIRGVNTNVIQTYKGRINKQTFLKEVEFFMDGYICTGCDSGNLFIWEKKTGRTVQMISADQFVVNSVATHPNKIPMIAASGIESDTKIIRPSDLKTFTGKKKRNEPRPFGLAASLLYGGHDDLRSDDSDDEDLTGPVQIAILGADERRLIANRLFAQNKYREAIIEYTEVIDLLDRVEQMEHANVLKNEIATSRVLAFSNRAAAYLGKEDYASAIKDCTEAVSIDPTFTKAWYRRAKAHFLTNQLKDAFQDIQVALSLNPQDQIVHQLKNQIAKKMEVMSNKN